MPPRLPVYEKRGQDSVFLEVCLTGLLACSSFPLSMLLFSPLALEPVSLSAILQFFGLMEHVLCKGEAVVFVLSFDTHKLRKAMDMDMEQVSYRSNEGKDDLLFPRFDEGDAGGGDRHRRSSATNFCHSHLPVKNEKGWKQI